MRPLRIIAVVIFTIFLLSPVSAQEEFEYVAGVLFHDNYRSVASYGDYVYCGGDYGLQIIDISDLDNPIFKNNCDIPYSSEIAIDGIKLYAIRTNYTYGNYGLRTYDISDPMNPVFMSYYETIYNEVRDIAAHDDLVYLIENSPVGQYSYSVIEIIDTSDPANPIHLGDETVDLRMYDLCVNDGYAYALYTYDLNPNGFYIFDVMNPEEPVSISSVDHGRAFSWDITISGHYAYISAYGIMIYDISEPWSPELIRVDNSFSGEELTIHGAVGYMLSAHYISTIDFSDPLNPQQMGNLYYNDDFRRLGVSENIGFAILDSGYPGYSRNLQLIDFTDLYDPYFMGAYSPPEVVYDVQVYEGHAYVANGYSGLQVIDIGDPSNPILGNNLEIQDKAVDIFIDGNYAYLADYYAGLKIFDISDPQDPFQVGSYNIYQRNTFEIYVDGIYAYVINKERQSPFTYYTYILDISDPSQPELMNIIEGLYRPEYVLVNDNHAYFSTRQSLEIFDVSDVSFPIHIASYFYRENGYGIDIEGDYVYAATSPSGIEIIDVSDPENPIFVSGYDSLYTSEIAVRDGYAFLSGAGRFYLMDVSDPTQPLLISSYFYPMIYYQNKLTLHDEYIYLAAYSSLRILRLTPTGLEEVEVISPENYSLSQNYPNPFNAMTTIRYDLPEQSDVRIEIYDIMGRKIKTLVSGITPAGSHSVTWDSDDIPSGIYFYTITAGEYRDSNSCVLLK